MSSLDENAEKFKTQEDLKVLFCVIMTHGKVGNVLYTSDGRETTVMDIIKKFDDNSGKPKVIQVSAHLIYLEPSILE